MLSKYSIIIRGDSKSIAINCLDRSVFLIENEKLDSLQDVSKQELIYIYNQRKESRQILYTWIFLTYSCNLECSYCIQQSCLPRSNVAMNKKHAELLLDFMKEQIDDTTEFIELIYFGGEPTLAFDVLEYIYLLFEEEFPIPVRHSIITNGYFWPFREQLKSMLINSIQITLDGPAIIHNKRRITPLSEPTYCDIIKNITWVLENMPKTKVQIRINVDKLNKDFIKDFLRTERFLYNPNVSVDIACTKESNSEFDVNLLSPEEFTSFYEEILWESDSLGIEICPPELGGCSLCFSNTFFVSPKGVLYRCPLMVGTESFSCGSLEDKVIDIEKYNYESQLIDHCINCKLFYYCNGGCKYNQIINGEDNIINCFMDSKLKNIKNYYKHKYGRYIYD